MAPVPKKHSMRSQYVTHEKASGISAGKKPGYSVAKMRIIDGNAKAGTSSSKATVNISSVPGKHTKGSTSPRSNSYSGKWAKAPAASLPAYEGRRVTSSDGYSEAQTKSNANSKQASKSVFELSGNLPKIDFGDSLAGSSPSRKRADASWARIDTAPHNPELSSVLPAVSRTSAKQRAADTRRSRVSEPSRTAATPAKSKRASVPRSHAKRASAVAAPAAAAIGAAGTLARPIGGARQNVDRGPGLLERIDLTRKKAIIILAVITVLLAVTMLYPAAREYYISLRGYDKANTELTLVQSRNDQIQGNIDKLSTDAGIEDYVRAQYGWVDSGESAGVVPNLVDTSTSKLPADINANSVTADRTWVNDVLDFVFAVNS